MRSSIVENKALMRIYRKGLTVPPIDAPAQNGRYVTALADKKVRATAEPYRPLRQAKTVVRHAKKDLANNKHFKI